MFEQALLTNGAVVRKPWTMAASLGIQAGLVSILVITPLIYTERIPHVRWTELLMAPSVPPPPPPRLAPSVSAAVRAVSQFSQGALVMPLAVPPKAATIVEEAPPASVIQGVGVEGGIGTPSGAPAGVIGSILAAATTAPPPPQAEAAKEPAKQAAPAAPRRIVQGGHVQAALLLRRVTPEYPVLARQARVAGVVKLHAIIGVDGRVRQLQAMAGHPLLVQAALDAVAQWTYRPTLLNGVPVEVDTVVEVTFTLR